MGNSPRRKLLLSRAGVESLLELPTSIQKQAVRKMRTIEAAPASAGYPLRRPLQGFRAIHSGRYRIIWQLLTLEDDEKVAEGLRESRAWDDEQIAAYLDSITEPASSLEH